MNLRSRHRRLKPVSSQLDLFNLLESRAVPTTPAARFVARRYRMSPRWATLIAQHAGIGGGEA